MFVGEILLVSMAADGPVESWQAFPEGRDTTPTSSFTQRDVNEGTVWYRHYGRDTQRDTFQFQVTNTHTHTQLSLCLVGSNGAFRPKRYLLGATTPGELFWCFLHTVKGLTLRAVIYTAKVNTKFFHRDYLTLIQHTCISA